MRAHVFWGFVFLLAGLAACSGKSRVFADDPGPGAEVDSLLPDDMAASGPAGVAGPGEGAPSDPALLAPGEATNGVPPRSPGASCVTAADCDAPSFCVDGVCCGTACNELCAACNVPGSLGTCSAAPSDEACGALLCAGFDTECRKLDTAQLSLNCQGFGTCKVNADCAILPEPSGAACQTGAGVCDGSGACLVAGKAALGQACATSDECAEGHCVLPPAGGAGICCDAACDGACQACSPEGHCESTPGTDTRCEAVACPPDDVCKDYTADVTASQCRSFGQCQTGRDCPALTLRPEGECECDATTGACLLRGGASCASATECASSVCGANGQGALICCAAACAEGQFCSTDGSACVACEGGAIECDGNTERRCETGVINTVECPNGCTAGTGCNGLPPLGFPCDAGQCATPNVCQPDVTGAQRCCSRDCAAEGKICAENGSCACQAGQVAAGDNCLLQNGDPCSTTAECQVGSTCTDGVCCQEACSGTCESCQPNTGLCVGVPSTQPDPLCGAGRQCTGARGDCRLTVRQPCTGSGTECTTNNCEPTVGNATQICCAAACTPDRPFCRTDGTSCVECETNADCGNGCNTFTGSCNALLLVGAPCGATAQCAGSAQCLIDQSGQTRCCESNCAAQGLLCNGAGQCVAPAPALLETVVGGAPAAFSQTLVGSLAATPRVWTVQNAGAVATGALGLNNANPGEFQVNGTCLNAVLQPGASCSVSITFAPSAPGTREATLTLNGGPGVALSVRVQGEARLPDGAPCPGLVTLCASSRCTEWFADPDGDGFGSSENVGGIPSATVCGDASLTNRPVPFIIPAGCRGIDAEIQYEPRNATPGLPNNGLDCCDRFFRCDSSGSSTVTSNLAFPGQDVPSGGVLGCGESDTSLPSDFDCDGQEEPIETSLGGSAIGLFDSPPCSMATTTEECAAASGSSIAGPTCGLVTLQGCSFSGGTCSQVNASQLTVLCL
jgi:hypothetical protein